MPWRVRLSEGLGFTLGPWHGCFGEALRHACLPTRTRGTPTSDDFRWQPQADELTRIR
jgi:hypothetical protein